MKLEDIQARLTRHLAGEDSLDFHDASARLDAITEGYHAISEEWALETAAWDGVTMPSDFFSHGSKPGTYNKIPPALVNQTDQPWGGRYPQFHPLISYYAAFCLYRDKGPEMYERAQFWLGLFREMATRVADRTLNREHVASLQDGEVGTETLGGITRLVKYTLDTSSLTPEQVRRLFPDKVITSTIKRVYHELTVEFELNLKEAEFDVPAAVGPNPSASFGFTLPPDFLSPVSRMEIRQNGAPPFPPYPNHTDDMGTDITVLTDGALTVTGHDVIEGKVRIQYTARPIPLGSDASKPWGGMYPLASNLLFRRVMRELLRGHTQTQEIANIWVQESELAAKQLVESLRNQDIDTGEAEGRTWAGMLRLMQFYLDTTDLSPEKARRYFPTNVRQGALYRAYLDMTVEHELWRKEASVAVDDDKQQKTVAVPADFLAPLPRAGFFGEQALIGGESPFADTFAVDSQAPSRRIVVSGSTKEGTLKLEYVAYPPPLVNQTDQPWNGMYPTANKLIVVRAMRDMMRGKKEVYNLSRFWQNEYDREIVEFRKYLRRFTIGQANRVKMGHGNIGIGDDWDHGLNRADHEQNYRGDV